jgi:hypothetical protein
VTEIDAPVGGHMLYPCDCARSSALANLHGVYDFPSHTGQLGGG